MGRRGRWNADTSVFVQGGICAGYIRFTADHMNDTGAAAPSSDPVIIALASGTALIGLLICIPSIRELSYLWSDNKFYGHAYALPVVAGFLAYGNRDRIARALQPLQPPAYGAPIAFVVACFEVLMYLGDVGSLAGLGIPLVMAAAAYGIGGVRLLRPLLLPLCFLALMVPPPRFIEYQLLFRLKLIVTEVSVWLLQAVGRPVLAEGNVILVPGHTLFVADACSGLTSIVTLLPLSCVVAYFLSFGYWRRVLIGASVVPLAMMANVFRVVVTVGMVSAIGIEAAQGALHESFGLATYILGTLAMIGVARILSCQTSTRLSGRLSEWLSARLVPRSR